MRRRKIHEYTSGEDEDAQVHLGGGGGYRSTLMGRRKIHEYTSGEDEDTGVHLWGGGRGYTRKIIY